MKQVVREIGILSAGKMGGIVYAGLGLVIGCIVALISLLGGFAHLAGDRPAAGVFGLFVGVGAIFFLPIFYGIVGFLAAMLGAFLYNLAAGAIGGVELEIS